MTLGRYQYTYDAASNVATRADNDGSTTTYGYDNANQLTSDVRTGTGGNNYSISYTYDGNGNRATKVLGGVTDTYSYDSHDKLTGFSRGGTNIKTYAYDNNGNCTSVTVVSGSLVTSLSYDYENRLTGITYPSTATNSFQYNGLGLRMQKVDSSGTVNYICDGTQPASAVLADSNATYTPGLSERRSSTSKFLHGDALGTTRGITNSSQAATDGLLFDAFGMSVSRTGTTPTPFGFVGGAQYQTDADSGLMLLGHRYYDSSIGRFITQDPIRAEDNWFAYCANNPLSNTDSQGTDHCEDLLKEIQRLRDEIIKRYFDLRNDKFDLYPTRPSVKPGIGNWSGHQQQYDDKRRRLRKKLKEFNDCPGHEQFDDQLPDDVWHWGTEPAPKKPAPRNLGDQGLQDETWILVPILVPIIKVAPQILPVIPKVVPKEIPKSIPLKKAA